jgi:hypothetical protein
MPSDQLDSIILFDGRLFGGISETATLQLMKVL